LNHQQIVGWNIKKRERKVMGRELEGTANGTECDATMTGNDEQGTAKLSGSAGDKTMYSPAEASDHGAIMFDASESGLTCIEKCFDMRFEPFFGNANAYAYL
jgi:hypothetical protein